jgi:hypothetical protein
MSLVWIYAELDMWMHELCWFGYVDVVYGRQYDVYEYVKLDMWMDELYWFGYVDVVYVSMVRRQIFRVGSEETQVDEINLRWIRGTGFRLIRALRRVKNPMSSVAFLMLIHWLFFWLPSMGIYHIYL